MKKPNALRRYWRLSKRRQRSERKYLEGLKAYWNPGKPAKPQAKEGGQ